MNAQKALRSDRLMKGVTGMSVSEFQELVEKLKKKLKKEKQKQYKEEIKKVNGRDSQAGKDRKSGNCGR